MMRGRKAKTFCFRKTSFVHPRSRTYYALLLGYFGLKFLPDIHHGVFWVLAEIWAPYSSHKIGNKFFIHHCPDLKEGSFECENVWFFSWANTHPFDLKFVALCPKFSGDSYVEFQEKTISGEFFRNFVQTKAILYRKLWNIALLSEILFSNRIVLKKFTQVLSYVVCTQVRRHIRKKNHKGKIRGRKTRTFCFRKISFVHPRSGTYYALLLGYFGLKILPDILHRVYWVLDEIWAPDSSHKIRNKFFIHHCPDWKEGSFECETVWFFRGKIIIRLTWNLSRYAPNSVVILTCNFRKKLFRENFSEILCRPRLFSTENCEISPYFLKFYSRTVLCWKNSHKYFHMLFAPK